MISSLLAGFKTQQNLRKERRYGNSTMQKRLTKFLEMVSDNARQEHPVCRQAAPPRTPPQACTPHAESKRAIYDSSGRSAVYAYERQGRSQGSPYRAGFRTPRARSGWSNFQYQQQQYNTHGVLTISLHLGKSDQLVKTLSVEDPEVVVSC